ncbi:MAG TPA: GMP/IMP nucleotidase [Pseudomonadales bacterium]
MTFDWQPIDTLLLDMDGTLLDLHFDNHFWLHYLPRVYGETFGLSAEEAIAFLHQRIEQEKGSINWYCLDFWSQELQLDIAGLKRDVDAKIALRPFADTFLARMRSLGKQLLLVTNAHRDSLDLKMEKTRLDHHFHAMISTHDYGVPKEHMTLWEALHADYRFDPARTLLIDDSEPILDCAADFGIGHLLTIRQPDSQKPPRETLKYPAFNHFDEIMPDD